MTAATFLLLSAVALAAAFVWILRLTRPTGRCAICRRPTDVDQQVCDACWWDGAW